MIDQRSRNDYIIVVTGNDDLQSNFVCIKDNGDYQLVENAQDAALVTFYRAEEIAWEFESNYAVTTHIIFVPGARKG